MATPYLRKISFLVLVDFHQAWVFPTVPLWIPAPDCLRSRIERVALVELERLAAVGPLLGHLAGKGLDRGGGEPCEHLRDMRAAPTSPKSFFTLRRKSRTRLRPISRLYAGAMFSPPGYGTASEAPRRGW